MSSGCGGHLRRGVTHGLHSSLCREDAPRWAGGIVRQCILSRSHSCGSARVLGRTFGCRVCTAPSDMVLQALLPLCSRSLGPAICATSRLPAATCAVASQSLGSRTALHLNALIFARPSQHMPMAALPRACSHADPTSSCTCAEPLHFADPHTAHGISPGLLRLALQPINQSRKHTTPGHRHPKPMPREVHKKAEGGRATGPKCPTCTSLLRQQPARGQA